MNDRDMRNIELLPSGHYRVVVSCHGEKLTGTVATYEEALDLRDELKRQIVDGGLAPTKGKTGRDLGPHFLGSRNGNRDADNETNRWNKHCAGALWARKAVSAVVRADGVAWLKSLKRTRRGFNSEQHGDREVAFIGWQTRKHCLNLARAFFAWAIDQECYGITSNPFAGLKVSREDGDEDGGYQEGWYLDPKDQARFFAMWDRTDLEIDQGDRWEKAIVQFAVGSGLRRGEMWTLHLEDVHVGVKEAQPRVEVRFGSWDPVKKRYRAPKGRKGEKKSRTVFLHGLALEAARAWLAILPVYAPHNPLGLMFPTERGARRTNPPRSWVKVVEAFGVIPRVGRKVWWHLLRHTCASSLVSGWWGIRWSLEDVSKVLGHTDVRTTQVYAHLAPSALQATALRAHAAYAGGSHGVPTGQRAAARKPENQGHARCDSNTRHSASKAANCNDNPGVIERHGMAVGAISHVLALVADERLSLPAEIVHGLGYALDLSGDALAAANARTA